MLTFAAAEAAALWLATPPLDEVPISGQLPFPMQYILQWSRALIGGAMPASSHQPAPTLLECNWLR